MQSKNLTLITVALLTLRAGFKTEKVRNKMLELLTTPTWLVNFIIIIYRNTYDSYTKEDKLTRESLKKALIAFCIAIFSEIGLTIAPFWVIFVFSYYMDGLI